MNGRYFLSIGILLFYYLTLGVLFVCVIRIWLHLSSEWVRKSLHIVYTMSIFLYLRLFSEWYLAVIGLLFVTLVFFGGLVIAENTKIYKKFAPERNTGEFKFHLLAAQLSLMLLLSFTWGGLGKEWNYLSVVAMMIWGWGDAAAALIGKSFGRGRIRNQWITGTKTVEGTLAMLLVAGAAMFFTLMIYADKPLWVCFWATAVVVPVSTVVELVSHKGIDTLTLPLTAVFLSFTVISTLPA